MSKLISKFFKKLNGTAIHFGVHPELEGGPLVDSQ